MKILLALSEHECALAYQSALRRKGHIVIACDTGQKSIQTYRKHLGYPAKVDSPNTSIQAFDVTVLDYEIGDMDALELGRQILSLNPKQRIILASANIQETISRVLKEFDMPAQILQKPIPSELLIASLEDGGIDMELKKFKTEITRIRKAIEINEV